jgi:hypothetical protein
MHSDANQHKHYELVFNSLFDQGRALAFPCDSEGRVDVGALTDRARENFRRAMAQVGSEYATPFVRQVQL